VGENHGHFEHPEAMLTPTPLCIIPKVYRA